MKNVKKEITAKKGKHVARTHRVKPSDLCTPIPKSKVNAETRERRCRELKLAEESLRRQEQMGRVRGSRVYKVVPFERIVRRHLEYQQRQDRIEEAKRKADAVRKTRQQQRDAYMQIMCKDCQ